ncbi:MAG TPA: hypothetical protein VJG83_01745 [archaeon]|nr:hypothetical protein [archaeon]
MALSRRVLKLVGKRKIPSMPHTLRPKERHQFRSLAGEIRKKKANPGNSPRPIQIGKELLALSRMEGFEPAECFRGQFLRLPAEKQDRMLTSLTEQFRDLAERANNVFNFFYWDRVRGVEVTRPEIEDILGKLDGLRKEIEAKNKKLQKIVKPEYLRKMDMEKPELKKSLGYYWHVAVHRMYESIRHARPLR